MTTQRKPLEGLTVLDLTRYLAGPYCTLMLAGLGARVIKIEAPSGGDFYRDRAPFGGREGVSSVRRTPEDLGLGLLHRSRNKQSITLNLRAPEGLDLLRTLCRGADVVVENYSPGVLTAMGCDYATLKALNPGLILCSISGFGQNGPLRDWRAYDTIAQAMSGMMSITGFRDKPPVRCGAAVADTVAPLVAVIGILSALVRRGVTGAGDWVDVSMLDVLAYLQPELIEYFQAGMVDFPMENRHPGGVPFNTFAASDGYVCLATVTDDDWHSLLRAMGQEALITDPRFAHVADRRRHVDAVESLVGEWIARHTRDEAVAILQRFELACGPVLTMAEMLDNEQLRARGMLQELALPGGDVVPGVTGFGLPLRFVDAPVNFDAPAPALGAHNRDVYRDLAGLDDDALEGLRQRGIV